MSDDDDDVVVVVVIQMPHMDMKMQKKKNKKKELFSKMSVWFRGLSAHNFIVKEGKKKYLMET